MVEMQKEALKQSSLFVVAVYGHDGHTQEIHQSRTNSELGPASTHYTVREMLPYFLAAGHTLYGSICVPKQHAGVGESTP